MKRWLTVPLVLAFIWTSIWVFQGLDRCLDVYEALRWPGRLWLIGSSLAGLLWIKWLYRDF